MRILSSLLIAVVAILALVGCSGPADTPTPVPEPTQVEPTATTAPASTANEGQVLFNTWCASCHNLSDVPQVGPGLAGLFSLDALPDGQAFSEETLATFITQGAGAMPGIPLSPEQMDLLIPYLREATQQ